MHPSVGSPFDRVVPKGGAVLSGHFIPEDTVVGITGWVTQRDKAVFGEDADFYRPERWLEVDERQVRIMDKNMLAVSTAPLNLAGSTLTICSLEWGTEVVLVSVLLYLRVVEAILTIAGKHVAMMVLTKTVGQIVRTFNMEWASEKEEWDTTCRMQVRQSGVIMRLKRREADKQI